MAEKRARRLRPEYGTIIMFVLASILAIYFTDALTASGYQGSTSSSQSASYFIFYIVATLLITAGILYMARKDRGREIRTVFIVVMVYIIFFVTLVLSNSVISVIFNAATVNYFPIPEFTRQLTVDLYIIWLFPPVYFGYELFRKPNWIVVNVTGLIMSIGIAAIWSLFLGLYFAIALLILMAVYDYISVFKTKHMVTLAKVALDQNIPMLFVMPESKDFDMTNLKIGEESGDNKAVLLGFGDVAIPSVLVVSSAVYGSGISILFLLLPLFGGIAGMVYLMFFMKRRPAPGLPAINSGVLAGFAIAYLLFAL